MPPTTLSEKEFQDKYGSTTGGAGGNSASGPTTLSADQFKKQYGDIGSSTGTPPAPESGGVSEALKSFAKGIFSAPATLLARPVQAAAEVGQLATTGHVDPEAINAATKKVPLFGGLIAPVPENAGDVQKDVGRAAETVALGTGAPIAGGALFGAGSSLEQGNDLFSLKTAADAAIGGAGGKILEWIGKPFLDGAGKVIGTITPKDLKPVIAGGAEAIAKFAATHDLPFGISTVTKPLSEGIQNGAQAIDTAIGEGVSNAGSAIKRTAAEQFPGLDPTEHFRAVNKEQFMAPTKINTPAFAKTTAIAADAERRGIDIGDELNKLGIQHDQNMGEGKFNTKDIAQLLRDKNYSDSNKVLRPAIQTIEHDVRFVPLSEVRKALLDRTTSVSDATEREAMQNAINRKYSDTSAEARAHPNGYSLTNLHDGRINAGQNGKFVPGVSTPPTVAKAKLARQEAQVFKNLFDSSLNTVDSEGAQAVKAVRAEFEKNFVLADYLKSLHGHRVPQGTVQKVVRLFGRGLGGLIGGKVGGFPGFLVGSRGGDMIFNAFETIPNPLKGAILSRIQIEEPEAFAALRKYLGDKETERLLQKALPPVGGSSFKETPATIFTTPGGVSTTDKGAAIDLTAVEKGKAKTGSSLKGKKLKDMMQKAEENQGPYVPPSNLPVIDAGKIPKKPSRLNDIKL